MSLPKATRADKRNRSTASAWEVIHRLAKQQEWFGEERILKGSKDVPTADETVAIGERVERATRRTHVMDERNVGRIDNEVGVRLATQTEINVIHGHRESLIHSTE